MPCFSDILIVLLIDDEQDVAGLLAGRERMTFNLSDRIRIFKEGEEIWTDGSNSIVLTHDVKEFIRLLKENVAKVENAVWMHELEVFYAEIDKLAGDKLK